MKKKGAVVFGTEDPSLLMEEYEALKATINFPDGEVKTATYDVDPFFQKELYLPQLTTTHDPTSMTVSQNNKLVIVGYNPLIKS